MLRNRLILAALWILSLVGISYYGGPVSYGFFAVITLIPVICLVYLLLVLARFKIYQHFESNDIVSGHKTPFYFTLQNEDWFAFCGVRVNFFSDFSMIDGLSDDIEYELLPQDSIKKETGLVCRYRGEYYVGIKSVTLRDFLCLFKITYKNREALRVRVVPDIVRLSALRNVDTDSLSHRETRMNPSYPDVTVREYTPGDDIRNIHWKQTAKTGIPMVRNYIGEEKNGVALIIDPSRISSKETEYLPVENRMLETAIALTLFIEEKNIPMTIVNPSGEPDETVVSKPSEFNGFYERVSGFSFREDPDRASLMAGFSGIKSIYEKNTVFIVTAFLDDHTLALCEELNRNETEAFVYLVRAGVDETSFDRPSVHTAVFTLPTHRSLSELM